MDWDKADAQVKRNLGWIKASAREQRRYEIARDVMAARTAAYALAFRFERSSEFESNAAEAVMAADALLAELERNDGVS